MRDSLANIRLPFFLIGLVSTFAAVRFFSDESYYEILLGISLAFLLFGFLASLFSIRLSSRIGLKEESRSWTPVVVWKAIVLVSIGLYFGYDAVMADQVAPETLMQKSLLAGWLVTMLIGLFMGIGVELTHRGSGRGVLAEASRVNRAAVSFCLVGMLVSSLFAINFAAAKTDKVYDWSYLKSTQPGEASMSMVQSLTEPMEVAIFFEADNEVLPFVDEYFQALSKLNENFEVSNYDKDLHPAQAEEFKVSRNGQIVFRKGDKRERVEVGGTLKTARKKLTRLDAEFQKAFLELNVEEKTAYFTNGHGEMSWTNGNQNPLVSLRSLERFLRGQQYALRFFGLKEGSGTKVPDDASLVVIVGPSRPFLKGEVEALKEYVDRGGRLFVFLDVEKSGTESAAITDKDAKDWPLLDYLASMGLKYHRDILANDKNYVSATKTKVDKWFLFSNIYTSHESVEKLAKNDERVPVILYRSGYFEVTPKSGDWRASETVRTLGDTFNDRNRNFQFDEATEKRNTYTIAAVATKSSKKDANGADTEGAKDGKVVVFADAHAVSDAIITAAPGSALFVSDSLKWLAEESQFSGATNSEEDVKIQHTQKENLALFAVSIFGVPSLVLLAGFIATRRRKRGGR